MTTFSRRNFVIELTTAFLTWIVLIAAPTLAVAQAGQLDTTFANKGIFLDNFSSATGTASAVALQSDGKIVVAGHSGAENTTAGRGVVLRLNTNGTLDSSFGSAGVISIKLGDLNPFIAAVAIQNDGKILFSGGALIGGADLVRLNSDGSFDTSFGNNGFVSLSMLPGLFVLQTDGKIVVLGQTVGNLNMPGLNQMQRFNSDGTLDTSFGKAGTAALVSGGSAIAVQLNGKFVVTSSAAFAAGNVARYNRNGSLDTSLGIAGQAAALAAPGIALQSDGRIVTAGSITNKTSLSGNSSGFGLARFNNNGTVDTTFGTRGGVVTPFPGLATAIAFPLLIQPNGDIVAGGSAGSSSRTSFALARYLSTGQLDTTFGTGGLVTTSFGAGTAGISALALQTDGKILGVGTDGAGDLVVARYIGQ